MDLADTGRRGLLKGGAAAVAAALAGPIGALATRVAEAGTESCSAARASSLLDSPYGVTSPVNDQTTGLPLIELPAGFTYKSYGWRGDVMADGLVTPGAHDGMGVVASRRVGRGSELVLIPGLAHRFQSAFKRPLLQAVQAHLAAQQVQAPQLAGRLDGEAVWVQ